MKRKVRRDGSNLRQTPGAEDYRRFSVGADAAPAPIEKAINHNKSPPNEAVAASFASTSCPPLSLGAHLSLRSARRPGNRVARPDKGVSPAASIARRRPDRVRSYPLFRSARIVKARSCALFVRMHREEGPSLPLCVRTRLKKVRSLPLRVRTCRQLMRSFPLCVRMRRNEGSSFAVYARTRRNEVSGFALYVRTCLNQAPSFALCARSSTLFPPLMWKRSEGDESSAKRLGSCSVRSNY